MFNSHPIRGKYRLIAIMLALASLAAACGSDSADEATADETVDETAAEASVVTVYTGRHYGIEPVFDEFTAQTGIEVRFTTGSDPELRERLIAEGANTPADVVMSADAANIELSAQAASAVITTSAGVFAPSAIIAPHQNDFFDKIGTSIGNMQR